MNKTVNLFLTLTIAALGITAIYLYFQNKKIPNEKIPVATPATQSTSSPSILPSPSSKIIKNDTKTVIVQAVNSGQFEKLKEYLTASVDFSLMSSGCCEPQSPQDAISQLSYINDGIPMDFNQNNEIIKNLKNKNEQLKNTYIGISKNSEHLAAFTIDKNYKINKIELSVSYKLYNQ